MSLFFVFVCFVLFEKKSVSQEGKGWGGRRIEKKETFPFPTGMATKEQEQAPKMMRM